MPSLKDQELAYIAGYIKEKYGVNLESRHTLIESRLGYYLKSRGFKTYSDYFRYAKHDPTGAEMEGLIYRLTTNNTFFLRESEQFEFFSGTVLPWIDSLPGGDDLRLWSAGCGAGEEPYGISVCILDFVEKHCDKSDANTTILASDISERALTAAIEGIYPHEKLSALTPERVSKYFIDLGNGFYRVSPRLRANVAFKKINLLDKYATRWPFHAIFCRNIMQYFDTETRKMLAGHFFSVMEPGAWLFVGQNESLANIEHKFNYVQPSIYRKPFE